MSASPNSSDFSIIDTASSIPDTSESRAPNASAMGKQVKVAAVQAEPAWLDLQGSVQKVISLIEEAGKNGANVLGFPE
ncbi:MAG: hypothetical protein Q9187_005160, partial [Circinaria calcarea]